MEIVYDDQSLSGFITRATDITPDHPVLVDRFLDSAIELDVDALYDGEELFLGGIMEHIEEAGIHSGDSACVLPAMTISDESRAEVRRATGCDQRVAARRHGRVAVAAGIERP